MIISILYFFILLIIFRYLKHLQIKDTPNWTMPLAFIIKIAMGLVFSYVYIYSNKNAEEILKEIKGQKTLSSFSLEFCLSYEEVSVIIPGINKLEYLLEYLNINYQLNDRMLIEEKLNKIIKPFKY